MSDTSRKLGKVISRLRHEKGLSQESFADMAGVHRTYVSQVERGLKSPTISVMIRFSQVLEIRLSDVFRGFEDD